MTRQISKTLVRSITVTTVTAIVASASAQGSGSWVIEYKGELDLTRPGYSTPLALWKKQDYTSFTIGDVYNSSSYSPSVVGGTATSQPGSQISGNVSVRLRWTGTTTPPYYPNYQIHTSGKVVSWSFAGYGYDGFNVYTGQPFNFDTRKLIQPGKVTEHETSLSVLLHGVNDYDAGTMTYSLVAAIDSRKAMVKASSIPDEYYIKGSNATPDPVYSLTDHLWDQNIITSQAYTNQLPQASNPITVVGATTYEIRTVGLPQGLSHSGQNGEIIDTSNNLATTFTGDVTQTRTGQQWYSFNESAHSTTVSENLPSFGANGPGWDIEPLGVFGLIGPNNYIGGDGSATHSNKFFSSDTISLNYKWDDGLEAKSQMILSFEDAFENPQPLMAHTVHEGTPTIYAFPDGNFGATKEYETWDSGVAKTVRFSLAGTAYKAASGAVSVVATAASMLSPQGALIPSTIALAGGFMSFGNPSDDSHPLTPDSPFQADTAQVKHLINFDSAVQQFLSQQATEAAKLSYLNYHMKWKAEYLPEQLVEVFLWDHYGPQGFAGQVPLEKATKLVNQCDSAAKRFTYVASASPINPTP